jgi:hypothetical protein
MPNQHSKKLRGLRNISDELWAEAETAAKALGSDRSAVTRAFYEWLVGHPGAQLPERPEPQRPVP